MTSARIVATNESVSEFGGTGQGRDFTGTSGWSTWEALVDIDLTTGFEKVSISNVSATRFDLGEALSFSSSGATATCHGTSLARDKMYYVVTGGTPTTADTITGDTTGATADIDSIDSTNTGVSFVLECYDDAASFDVGMTIAGSTTSSSFRHVIRAATGEGHDGTGANGVHIKNTLVDYAIRSNDNNTIINDLIFTAAVNTTTNSGDVANGSSNTGTHVAAVLVIDPVNSGSGV